MIQIRENKHKHLTSQKVTAMFVRTTIPATVTRAKGLYIFVAVRKEFAP